MSDALATPAPEARMSDRTISRGRETLGYVFYEADGTFSATDADGKSLGSFFPKLEAARAIVITNARGPE